MYDAPQGQPPVPEDDQPAVDAAKLWSGGVATALVAALVSIVGIMVARGVLDIAILAPADEGAWETASAATYAVAAVFGALIATALMHLLLLTTPRPTMFFGWIMFLIGVVAAIWPFSTNAAREEQIATAALNALIVLAIWMLVTATANRAMSDEARASL